MDSRIRMIPYMPPDEVLFDLPGTRQTVIRPNAIIPIFNRPIVHDKLYVEELDKDGKVIRYGINSFGQQITTSVVVKE